MKRLFTIFSFVLFASICFAQGGEQEKARRDAIAQKIQNEKIAYFTKEIDLTSEEAQAFWPIYFECQKEIENAHNNTMKALWEAASLNGRKDATESEIDKALTAYNKAVKEEASIADKYYPKYKKILPASKIAKLYMAEESFKRVILNNFKWPNAPGHHGGAPQSPRWNNQNFGYKPEVR